MVIYRYPDLHRWSYCTYTFNNRLIRTLLAYAPNVNVEHYRDLYFFKDLESPLDNYFDVDQVEGASIDNNHSPDKSSKLLDNRCLSLRGECDEPLQSLIEVRWPMVYSK